MGRDCHARRRHDSTLVWLKQVDFVPLTYAGDVYGLSSRGRAFNSSSVMSVTSGAACGAGGAGGIGAGMEAAMVDTPWRGSHGAVHTCMVARCERKRECVTSAQCLGRPDRGRGRTAARRPDFHGLHENRLGYLAVLLTPLALVAIPSLRLKDGAVLHRGDLDTCYTLAVSAERTTTHMNRKPEQGVSEWS